MLLLFCRSNMAPLPRPTTGNQRTKINQQKHPIWSFLRRVLVRSRLVLIWPEKKRDPSFRLLLLLTDAQNVRPLAAVMSAVHDEKKNK